MAALSDEVCTVVDDWIETNRPDSTDEHGRHPLLASPEGRHHDTSLRASVYTRTRPCHVGVECPHGRDPEDCEATKIDSASKCPSSVSPHAIRRGAITHWLREDVPVPVVSSRMQVSPEVIDQHYDQRTEQERMEQCRQWLKEV